MTRILPALLLCGAVALVGTRATAERDEAPDGDALYDRLCAPCHGAAGDGRGPAAPWLWPRPHDFTDGQYAWRTTPSGAPPTAGDLARTIRRGVPGTSMHPFGAALSDADIDALVDVVQGFAPDVFDEPAEPVDVGAPPAANDDVIARGAELYTELGCASCHGEDGTGDGPAGTDLKDAEGRPAAPYDLTAEPLRRPRPPGADPVRAIYTSLVTGLSGTAMPAYRGAAPERDLWAVAAYVDSIRYRGPAPDLREATDVHDVARELDRERRITRGGYWPGREPDEVRIWGQVIELQGEPPGSLAPAQASLDARRCARCHAEQYRQWTGSFHNRAAGPGLVAQVAHPEGRGAWVESCQRCHAPLAEQLERLRPGHRGGTGDGYSDNPAFDADLRAQGITCAACHVRQWRRHGPPLLEGSGLLNQPGYPVEEMSLYQRSDFCLPCHQLPARQTVGGKPLLNTYREWLEGPYMRRGIQCQHCHMPNREHTWKGVHDPETFRQGIQVEAIAGRSPGTGAVSVRARVRNVGAGHFLPTTPTPAAFVSIELVDADGWRIPGAFAAERIGRHLQLRDGRFVEVADTRIPPGEAHEIAAAWKDGRVGDATHARIVVRVEPDEYYERFYASKLSGQLRDQQRALYEEALEAARSSHYVAEETLVPLE